jgi:hypothetical protein
MSPYESEHALPESALPEPGSESTSPESTSPESTSPESTSPESALPESALPEPTLPEPVKRLRIEPKVNEKGEPYFVAEALDGPMGGWVLYNGLEVTIPASEFVAAKFESAPEPAVPEFIAPTRSRVQSRFNEETKQYENFEHE